MSSGQVGWVRASVDQRPCSCLEVVSGCQLRHHNKRPSRSALRANQFVGWWDRVWWVGGLGICGRAGQGPWSWLVQWGGCGVV